MSMSKRDTNTGGLMLRKTMIFIVLVLLISTFSLAEVLEVGKGTLKIGAILQTTFLWNQSELSPETSFTMKRARFLFFVSCSLAPLSPIKSNTLFKLKQLVHRTCLIRNFNSFIFLKLKSP